MPTIAEVVRESLPPKYQGNPFLSELGVELATASEQGKTTWDQYASIIVRHLTSLGLTESFVQEAARKVIPRLEGHGLIIVSNA